MPSLPAESGALTFLFTDIEGLPRRWETDPCGDGPALARHDPMLRAEIGT